MKTIRSSMKTKPEPAYYKRKIDTWINQRNAIYEQIEAAEQVTGEEAKELRRKATSLQHKIAWASFQLPVAIRMRDQAEGR